MAKCVDIKKAWDFGVLCDWFINSIDETEPPCWTPEHIEELLDGFYVIPKRKEIAAPVFDAEPVMQWISVKDRLPEKGLLVLCVGAKGGMFLGKDLVVYNGDNCAYAKVPNSRNSRNAVYWMPLPEPPEGE